MKREIWFSGYVHSQGGAGPEMAHLIDLFLQKGVEVHMCVFPWVTDVLDANNPRRRWCDERGVHTHVYEPGIFKDKVLVCFCQNDFMDKLPEIAETGRPRLTIWFNCMTWNHGKEAQYHRDGLIDVFGFQSQYQRQVLLPFLLATGKPVREMEGYLPYFSLRGDNLHTPQFQQRVPGEEFVIGRLSRDDAAKWPGDWWEMCFRISAPQAKKVFAIGYGPEARKKCGDPETQEFAARLNRQWWGYCSNSAQVMNDFWPQINLLLHTWDGFKENYPRALLEAMAAGVPIICDRAGGNPEIVQDGVTGFLVESADEAIYRASQLAWDEALRRRMTLDALHWLQENAANPERAWEAWKPIFDGG